MSTLLVIDDEPLTRDCFHLLFPKGQVRVLTAGTARLALSGARKAGVL